jgi:RNA polymerase sigma factor (sigma-70 family)
MIELIDLIRKYQAAKSLEERMESATEIHKVLVPDLRGYIRSRCHANDVDDVQQETMLGIFKGLSRFRGNNNAQAWQFCYQVAWHKLSDIWRTSYRRRTVTLDVEDLWRVVEATRQERPFAPGDEERLERAMEALRQLGEVCFDMLWKHFILGWTYAKVGAAHNKSSDAARMKSDRCLESARTLLKIGD